MRIQVQLEVFSTERTFQLPSDDGSLTVVREEIKNETDEKKKET